MATQSQDSSQNDGKRPRKKAIKQQKDTTEEGMKELSIERIARAERLLWFVETFYRSHAAFARLVGISRSRLSGMITTDPQNSRETNATVVYDMAAHADLNPIWFLFGRGPCSYRSAMGEPPLIKERFPKTLYETSYTPPPMPMVAEGATPILQQIAQLLQQQQTAQQSSPTPVPQLPVAPSNTIPIDDKSVHLLNTLLAVLEHLTPEQRQALLHALPQGA
jgi:hypothetical protein